MKIKTKTLSPSAARAARIRGLKRLIIADSIERRKQVEALIRLVREDAWERANEQS